MKDDKKSICVFHDIERGLCHAEGDPVLAKSAGNDTSETFQKMLNIEKEMNVKTTYNVVGLFLEEVKTRLKQDGHCIGFHSYDHQVSRQPVTNYTGEGAILTLITKIGYKATYHVNKVRKQLHLHPLGYQQISHMYRNVVNKIRKHLSLPLIVNQLAECQSVDYRIKGYRPYQTNPISEISDNDLCYFNFEWTTIDKKTPGAEPTLQNRIVKIPVFCGDHEMLNLIYPTRPGKTKLSKKSNKVIF